MLVCPICKGKLEQVSNELICYVDKLAFRIDTNVVNINEDQAREITSAEINNRKTKYNYIDFTFFII
jgi:uncharacterized protein YbaR (Trm112 family)